MRISSFFLLLACLLAAPALPAQTQAWWADNVGWDGKSHWSDYLIFSPGFLGPNALPVPRQTDGRIDNRQYFSAGGAGHWRPGEQTGNLLLAFHLPLVRDFLSMELRMMPQEWFETSHEIKTERQIFYRFYDERRAIGDMNLDTEIQLLRQEKQKLDALLRINYRFPTSSNYGAGRSTDSPGYHFDLTFGRSWGSTAGWRWRPQAMLGFLVWQTNDDRQFQNDAALFGLALELQRKTHRLRGSLDGYMGYMDNGDRPLLARLRYEWRLPFGFVRMHLQQGLHDFPFRSLILELGWVWGEQNRHLSPSPTPSWR